MSRCVPLNVFMLGTDDLSTRARAHVHVSAIHLFHKSLNGLIRSLLISQGDSESVPYIDRSASGPRDELSKSRGLNQSFRNPVDRDLPGQQLPVHVPTPSSPYTLTAEIPYYLYYSQVQYEARSEPVSLPSYRGGTGSQERLPSRGRYGHVALAKVSRP
eukprot:COSAG02_NODE_1690_length_11299_cov_21.781071_5_plen_159_part_00